MLWPPGEDVTKIGNSAGQTTQSVIVELILLLGLTAVFTFGRCGR